MPYEHVPQATKAGSWVFPSAVPACDFETGLPVGKRLPRFPYYASDATAQAEYLLENMDKVLEAAGTDITNVVKAHLYETDLLNFAEVDAVWARWMPRPPTRASMAVRDLLVPRAVLVANLLAVVPDDAHTITETRAGIRWHPVDTRKVNYSPGIAVGDNWLFMAGQLPVPDFWAATSRAHLRTCRTTRPTSSCKPNRPCDCWSSSSRPTATRLPTFPTRASTSCTPSVTTEVSRGRGAGSMPTPESTCRA